MVNFTAIADRFSVETGISKTESGQPVLDGEDEEIRNTCSPVNFVFGDDRDAGPGTLYTTTRLIMASC